MHRIPVSQLIVAASLLVSPVAATATATGSAQQPVASAQTADANAKIATAPEEKKICKQLPTSGSRLPNRTCLTAKQWKEVEEEASE